MAQLRWRDALALRDTGRNARANGAMYLGGYAVECQLKARLLEKHTWLQQRVLPGKRTPTQRERRLLDLVYRHHDIASLLDALPEVTDRLRRARQGATHRLVRAIRRVAAWHVRLRYDTASRTMREASEFLDEVKELMKWLA